MRPPDRRAIPTGEASRFRHTSQRTLVLRISLLVALLVALALAVLVARAPDVRHAPLVPTGTTGILVLDLSASTNEAAFGQTIQKLAAGDERVGVVAFSDTAYELVPPGTPGRELLPLLRYFPASGTGLPTRNPWDPFRSGTRISEGVRLARDILLANHVRHGSLVIVSDFEILPDEVGRLADLVGLLRGDGTKVRVVPLDPTPERRARIKAILGAPAILRESSESAPVRAPEARSLAAAAPWTFVLVGALLVALLGVNERLLSRLEVRR